MDRDVINGPAHRMLGWNHTFDQGLRALTADEHATLIGSTCVRQGICHTAAPSNLH